VGLPGSLISGRRAVPVHHRPALPAGDPHQVTLVAPLGQPRVGKGVAEHVRVQLGDARLGAPAAHHLADAVHGHRLAVVGAQPQRWVGRQLVASPHAEVPVQRRGGLGAERHGPGAAALAQYHRQLLVEIDVGAIVLAAGGRCYAEAEARGEFSTNHPNATGETTRIAVEAGAETRDLDALQYHPNGGAWPATMQGYSIPETTRAYGAVLLNVDGEEFTDSLGPRDAVSQAIFDEVEKGKGVLTPDGRPAVWLDTTRIAPDDAEISLPYMLRRYRGADIDPLAEPIYTYPVLHYQNGGLVIDEHAETTLEGTYACGEIAGGTHGRNRMMGNSLLECTVFGRRAGQAAAQKARP